MTISKTIGSGGDFSTINAWVSWVQSNAVSGGNLTDNVVANILQNGISPTASDTVSGWAPGGSNYTTTIQANAGGGFKDNANAQTNALAFNAANGAYINYSGTSGTFLTISVNLCTVQYLQMKVAGQYKYAINFTSTLTSATVNANIFDATNGSNAVNLPTSNSAANVVVKNNAVFWDNTSRQGKMIIGNNYLAYNNTFGGTTSGASAINCFATGGYPVGTVITNNLCVALTTNALIVPGNHYSHGITGSNNANTGASIMSTGTGATGTTGITGSNEVQNTASDLRLNKTSTVAKDGGATVASVTVDIVGTTRPQGSAYDIGCWELVQFNPACAQSQGVIGDTAMYLKNTSGQYLGFGLINATNGSALIGATVTAYRSIDGGSQTAVTGTVSGLGNGQYQLAMSQADTNGNDITFLFTATSAAPVEKTIVTQSLTPEIKALASGDLALAAGDIGCRVIISNGSPDYAVLTPPFASLSPPEVNVVEVSVGTANTLNVWSPDWGQLIARVEANGNARLHFLSSTTLGGGNWSVTDRLNLNASPYWRNSAGFDSFASTNFTDDIQARTLALSSTVFVVTSGVLSGGSNVGTARVATWTGSAWQFGPVSSIGDRWQAALAVGLVKVSSTSFAMAFSSGADMPVIVGNISGTGTSATITFGTRVDMTSPEGGWAGYSSVSTASNLYLTGSNGSTIYTTFIEYNGTNQYRLAVRVYTVSGTTLTYSTTNVIVTFSATSVYTANFAVTTVDPSDVESGNFVATYQDQATPTNMMVCAVSNGVPQTPQILSSTKSFLACGSIGQNLTNFCNHTICAGATKFVVLWSDGTIQNFDLNFSTGAVTANTSYSIQSLAPAGVTFGTLNSLCAVQNETTNRAICFVKTESSFVSRGGGGFAGIALIQFDCSGASTAVTDVFKFDNGQAKEAHMVAFDLVGSPNKYLLLSGAQSSTQSLSLMNRASNLWATNLNDQGPFNGTPVFS